MATGLAELGVGGTLLVSRLPNAVRRLNEIRSWKRFHKLCKKNDLNLHDDVAAAWQQVKSGKGAVQGVGNVAKYPINNFLDFVNATFTTAQKQLFTKAENFYKSFNPSFNVNELRGIDFDLPIVNVLKQEDNVMYQMVTLDKTTGNPRFGSYFFENINEDVTKLGIGDLNRIKADGRVKVKIVLNGEVDFLKSKTTNIEDWTGTGNIFEGGGNQFYNPTGRNKIKSYEIIETY